MTWFEEEPLPKDQVNSQPGAAETAQKNCTPPAAGPELSAQTFRTDPAAPATHHRASSNSYLLIFGMKGMGKTLMLRQLYAARIRAGRSGTFVDRIGNNNDLGGVVVTSPQGWYAAARAALSAERPHNIIVQPGRGSGTMGKLWAMIYEVGSQLLCIDEAEAYANASRIDPQLHELISLGRNQRVDMATTVRVPPELHRVLRGNADVVVSFRQPSQYYAEVLNRECFHLAGGEPLLMTLPQFAYVRAENGNVTVGKVHIR